MHADETTSDHGFADRPLPDQDLTIAFVMERRWLPGVDGTPNEQVACTNVPHHVVDLSSRGFDWGNAGPGGHDLALNILETALAGLDHRGPRSRRLHGTCFTLGLLLRQEFVALFVAALPEEGGSLPRSDVEEWIQAQVASLEPAHRAILSPRYACEAVHPGDHWSAAELELILGTALAERPDGLYTADGRRIARLLEPHPLDTAEWEALPL